MALDEQIKPFKLVRGTDSTSLILGAGEWQQAVFDERADDGCQGSGDDWASVAQVFLDDTQPAWQGDIELDPESGMFCAYSNKPESIAAFALAFHAACADTARLRNMLSRAELD